MPIYEFRCGTCNEPVELLVRSSQATPLCPSCGSPLTRKRFSTPYIITGRTQRPAGHTCCGREERCESPACSEDGAARRGRGRHD
jgi:putative FmdB family regulatory protein